MAYGSTEGTVNDQANGQGQDSDHGIPEGGRLGDLRKRVLFAAAYYAAVIAILLLGHWFTFKVETSSVILLVALIAPFMINRLSSFEFGGLKVELSEFKHEVRGATTKLSQEVSQARDELNSKLDELATRSREYLQPQQPLEISDAKAEQLRKEIDITDEEVNLYLGSPNPDERILAYFQLQKRPDPSRLSSLSECFFLEGFLASRQKETRPLWQLLVAVGILYPMSTEADAKREILMAMRHSLEWLEANKSIDRGGQCKTRLRLLIERFQ
jgi:hypothetical protein